MSIDFNSNLIISVYFILLDAKKKNNDMKVEYESQLKFAIHSTHI